MIEIPDTFRGGEDAEIETQKVSAMGSGYIPSPPTKVMQDILHPAGTSNVLQDILQDQTMSYRMPCRKFFVLPIAERSCRTSYRMPYRIWQSCRIYTKSYRTF